MQLKRNMLFLSVLFIVTVIGLSYLFYRKASCREYQLTLHLFYATNPSWSPNGQYLTYEADDNIWLRDIKKHREILVSCTGNCSYPVWSPTGRKAVIIYYGANDKSEIWGFDKDISNWHLLDNFDKEILSNPIWSSDEKWIKVVVSNEEMKRTEIWKFSYTGEEKTKMIDLAINLSERKVSMYDTCLISIFKDTLEIFSLENGKSSVKKVLPCQPDFYILSNDEKKLAFSSVILADQGDYSYPVYVYFILTGELKQITLGDKGFGSHLFWSPNDRYLGFSEADEADTSVALYVFSLETGSLEKITCGKTTKELKSFDTDGSWSPDGKRIAFTRIFRGSTNLESESKSGSYNPYPLSPQFILWELGYAIHIEGAQIWIVRVPNPKQYCVR